MKVESCQLIIIFLHKKNDTCKRHRMFYGMKSEQRKKMALIKKKHGCGVGKMKKKAKCNYDKRTKRCII